MPKVQDSIFCISLASVSPAHLLHLGPSCLSHHSSILLDILSSSWFKPTDLAIFILQYSQGSNILGHSSLYPHYLPPPHIHPLCKQSSSLYLISRGIPQPYRWVLQGWEISIVLLQIEELTLSGWWYWMFPPNQPHGIQSDLSGISPTLSPYSSPFNNFRYPQYINNKTQTLLAFIDFHSFFPALPSVILSDPPILHPYTSIIFMVPVIATFSMPLWALPMLFCVP